MGLLAYWKQGLELFVVVAIFFAGWHVRGLHDEADAAKQVQAGIVDANKKLVDNNKVDINYNRDVTIIDVADNKYKIEDSNEKNAHCAIPSEWVRTLHSASN